MNSSKRKSEGPRGFTIGNRDALKRPSSPSNQAIQPQEKLSPRLEPIVDTKASSKLSYSGPRKFDASRYKNFKHTFPPLSIYFSLS